LAEELEFQGTQEKEDAIEILEKMKNKFDPKKEEKVKFVFFSKLLNKRDWFDFIEQEFN
jgi:hypothetical protein